MLLSMIFSLPSEGSFFFWGGGVYIVQVYLIGGFDDASPNV